MQSSPKLAARSPISHFRNIDWQILGILAPVSNVGTILILGILPSIDATTNYD